MRVISLTVCAQYQFIFKSSVIDAFTGARAFNTFFFNSS